MTRLLPFVSLCVLIPAFAWAQPDLTPPAPPPNTLPNDLPANALPDQPVEQEGVEALTKGPIHEAFADPASPDPQASPIIPKAPPADVPEQPAAYKPDGDFIWIPGYWSWDDDRNDFLWVTGVWRQPPPGMRWVPGYWQEAVGGWQRVKGFWVQEQTQDVAYYNQPPASLEVGPSSPAPASNYFWIPGSWNYANANTGFNWQAGYWAPYQQNWVYVPARWTWTPAGYVYVPGYWDYSLGNRGQLFAPVYFRSPLYAQAGWTYRPSIVIPTGNLFIHLWMQPRYGSYYFGNYFGPQYANRGFISWSSLPSQHFGYYYDPFYSYAHVHYRQQGIDYLGRVQGWHNYYADHPEHRTPPTFHEQRDWLKTPAAAGIGHDAQLVARPIDQLARSGDSPIKLKQLDEHALRMQADHAKQIRESDEQRRTLERQHAQLASTMPAADQEKTRTEPNRSGRGEKLPGGRAGIGDAASKTSPTAKLTLPKIDAPKTGDVAVKTPGNPTAETRIRDRVNVPPLPNAEHAPRPGDRQNTASSPQNLLREAEKSSSRSTFGAKTGDASPFPSRNDSRGSNRDLPGREIRTPDNRGSDRNDNVITGRAPNDSPLRAGEIPSLPPGSRTNAAGAQSRDRLPQPGINQPGSTPPTPTGKSPSFSPRDFANPPSTTPPIGNRDRGSSRGDQPTFQGFGAKSGTGNANPQQPQLQPQRGPSRPTNENSKGKGRNDK